jgi:hypothetical protein
MGHQHINSFLKEKQPRPDSARANARVRGPVPKHRLMKQVARAFRVYFIGQEAIFEVRK